MIRGWRKQGSPKCIDWRRGIRRTFYAISTIFSLQVSTPLQHLDLYALTCFRFISTMPITAFWEKTIASIKSVVEFETDLTCNLANISAILFEELNLVKDNKVNWAGFYIQRQPNVLVLGPFQGSSLFHP